MKLKKIFAGLMLVALAAFSSNVAQAGIASTYKYEVRIVDQYDEPIASGATVRVKTAGTDTDASIWPTDDTSTGTLTGSVTPDSTGIARFYGLATSYDIIVHYRGNVYAYEGITPGKDRRVQVDKFDAAINLDTDSVAVSASTGAITVPLKGDFFRVTGTSQLRTITSTGHQIGKRITLFFASGLNIHTDGNIVVGGKLIGSLQEVGAGSAIEVRWTGSKWVVL